jgi:hypothetical protein
MSVHELHSTGALEMLESNDGEKGVVWGVGVKTTGTECEDETLCR